MVTNVIFESSDKVKRWDQQAQMWKRASICR
jgi:hypothetical protein